MFKTIVVGVGSFGEKRARAVKESLWGELIGVADIDMQRATKVAQRFSVQPFAIEEAFENKADVVLVATPNKYHTPVTVKALESGKHVLCEKPLSLNAGEVKKMVEASKKAGRFLKMGSNHRYFTSVMRAHEIFESGEIGDIISFNGRIGNNGERVKESWFWDKELSGGGTLLDNGCHLIDIARWFMGDFSKVMGVTSNIYWKQCLVEDTACGVFVTSNGQMAIINSCWRQMAGYLHFEINGTGGYITVDGRFDTHGGDKVYWQGNGGKTIRCEDFGHIPPNSYVLELDDFYVALQNGIQPVPSGEDGLKIMAMIDVIYNNNGKEVNL